MTAAFVSPLFPSILYFNPLPEPEFLYITGDIILFFFPASLCLILSLYLSCTQKRNALRSVQQGGLLFPPTVSNAANEIFLGPRRNIFAFLARPCSLRSILPTSVVVRRDRKLPPWLHFLNVTIFSARVAASGLLPL